MEIESIIEGALSSGRHSLLEHPSKQILNAYGIPVVSETPAPDAEAAVEEARKIGFPVVLKGVGPAHKTEKGLVRLNLEDEGAVASAAAEMEKAAGEELEGFLVQPQIRGNREFVAGLFRDPLFGPVVMFGLGGIFTEALSDVAFRLTPLGETDAAEMLTEIRGADLLGPFRGEGAADRDNLIRTLTALSRIAVDHPRIAEIDINPLIVSPDGSVTAVDALIALSQKGEEKSFTEPVDPQALGKLFHPRSVAFVGASAQLGKWGHILITTTIKGGYEGGIYFVNPKGGTIAEREVFKNVCDIPGPVDLAVVTIPAEGVMDLLPQFQEKGIKNMVLITSGFGETGEAGRELEQKLMAAAKDAGILVLGPNTMGICNPHINLYCTGSHVWPRPGSTAVVAQSGNMGTQLLGFAEQQGIGIRVFSGSGNEAMITIEDYLDGFEADEKSRIVMLYVESVKNGRRFYEAAKRISKKKPIVLLKGGRTSAGARAAATHTGAMSSDQKVFEAVCRQAGIVTAQYPMDLLDLSAAFSSLPMPRGNRVAILTLGGGWGVVTSDLCEEFGLSIPELAPEIVSRLDAHLPPYWSRTNPIDIVGEHDDKLPMLILEALLQWDGCDAVINLGIMGRRNLLGRYLESVRGSDPTYSDTFLQTITDAILDFEKRYVEHIVRLMETYQKPILGVSILDGDEDQTLYRVQGSRFKGVFYPTPERVVKTLAEMCAYQRFLDRA